MDSVQLLLMNVSLLFTKKILGGSCRFKKCCYQSLGVVENANTVKIRRGYIGIYVGKEGKRYEVPVKYLKFPPLQERMKQSQDDEFDIKIDGPVKLACTPEAFEYQILKLAKNF